MNEEENPEQNYIDQQIQQEEEINPMLTIEEPKHWWILITFFILLGILIIWSIFGRITTDAVGRSVSISSGGVFLVEARAQGNILDIFVQEGNLIEKGVPIAKVNNPKLWSIAQNIEAQKYKKEQLEAELVLLRRALQTHESLFARGLVAKKLIDESKAAIMQKLIEIDQTQAAIDTAFAELELNSFVNKEAFAKYRGQWQLHGKFMELDKVINELSTIVSPYAGKVLEVRVNNGEGINREDPITWIERPQRPPYSQVFYGTVPANTMGRLKLEQKVIIEPASVDPKEYGAIIGKIEAIYPYPVSQNELMQSIGNKQLVEYLIGTEKALTQVKITPNLDPKTISGFEWTSKEGPPFKIAPGTLCKIRIIVDEQPPISYLIPLWKIKPQS